MEFKDNNRIMEKIKKKDYALTNYWKPNLCV